MTLKFFSVIIINFFLLSVSALAQEDFAKLSPKQRIKLGKKEEKNAKNDPEYLKLMDEGLTFFQQKKYDKAIAKYEAAHNRRPNNVYPMIMIEDISVAKDLQTVLQNTEEKEIQEIIEPTSIELEYKEPEIGLEEEKSVEKPAEKSENIELQTEERIVINTPESLEKRENPKSETTIQKKEKKVYENDGVYREILKEGSATILETTIVKYGKSTILREVKHTWGGEFYFYNKDPITKQEYAKLIAELVEE